MCQQTEHLHRCSTGSIPERDAETNNVYNTCTVYSPTGASPLDLTAADIDVRDGGALVATHRKVHLFDIDIPGKIKFKVCFAVVL